MLETFLLALTGGLGRAAVVGRSQGCRETYKTDKQTHPRLTLERITVTEPAKRV